MSVFTVDVENSNLSPFAAEFVPRSMVNMNPEAQAFVPTNEHCDEANNSQGVYSSANFVNVLDIEVSKSFKFSHFLHFLIV